MLYQALPPIESDRLDRWERWLAPALAAAAGITVGILLLLVSQPMFAAAAAGAGLAAGTVLHFRGLPPAAQVEPLVVGPDYSLVGSALSLSRDPAALTTAEGSLLIVNTPYRDRFGANRAPLT